MKEGARVEVAEKEIGGSSLGSNEGSRERRDTGRKVGVAMVGRRATGGSGAAIAAIAAAIKR